MQERIPKNKWLEPYFKIAADSAKLSECVRKQFGALIIEDGWWKAATNKRVSHCCNGICMRSALELANGERVEVGAEVHAETALLIDYKKSIRHTDYFVLVGFANGLELLGPAVYPCHTCALNIKYFGFKYIYIKDIEGIISPVSIAEIIEYREQEWLPID